MSVSDLLKKLVTKGVKGAEEITARDMNLLERLGTEFRVGNEVGVNDYMALKNVIIKMARESENPAEAQKVIYKVMREDGHLGKGDDALRNELKLRELKTTAVASPAPTSVAEVKSTPKSVVEHKPAKPQTESEHKSTTDPTPANSKADPVAKATAHAERLAEKAAEKAEKAAEATKTAESIIRSSLTDMYTVHTTNGKMPKDAFFKELGDALHHKNLLALSLQETGREAALVSPKQIFEALENRQPITEQELRKLGEYFSRNHNDRKLAQAAQVAPPMQTQTLPGQGRRAVVDVVYAMTRNIQIQSGERRVPTIAQAFEWETGEVAGLGRRLASSVQERPIRSSASALLLGTSVYAASSIGYTHFVSPESPTWLGREAMSLVTPDKNKDAQDYAEYLYSRYNAKPQMAIDAFKKYYGIDVTSNTQGRLSDNAIEALLTGATKGGEPVSGDVTQALLLFTSQRNYGKEASSVGDLQEVIANQITAQRLQVEAGAAVAPPVDLGKAFNRRSAAPEPEEEAIEEIDGEKVDNNLTTLRNEGYIKGWEYNQLKEAWIKTTKAPVAPSEEMTAKNVATNPELVEFTEEAMKILRNPEGVGRTQSQATTVKDMIINGP